ncbi:MMPL family transporter [Mycolicibacterium thermoresistibile]|uniref:MMPL domain-containing protein n=2 Tax=Mycolicibacterium thermoresistibile TaxID=1797 RepID=G7CLP7_MYCT3|nr:MMPL family transporter [Mycolicibacterium thermoresistibile]EHI11131.1 MMPL domain-containing protein [Mycolicibacterium thermoresistibile ATCC 19527]MCV7190314.1 MMPL family transporter [Mycolicibacterium thermoresistibile]GAT15158.1 MMPL domain-containing protein [Mycolicibacterium thermoresistibile]SNW18324.1 putative RND superfamily drug exporter [Mycolicibacterium thermoresistibile]
MLETLARRIVAAPRRVLALVVLVIVGAAMFGLPVAGSLSAGGFRDPHSESAQASALLAERFDQTDMQLLVTVSSSAGVYGEAARRVGTEIVAALEASPQVAGVQSPWTVPPGAGDRLVSEDATAGLIVAPIRGNETESSDIARQLAAAVGSDRDRVNVRAGGPALVNAQIDTQTEHDLLVMEAIAIPLSFVVLVWVFGGLLAAALPLAVGVLAIVGSMAVLRTFTMFTEVSVFALNLSIAMGLALAIDYTLLLLNRYRDELAEGCSREQAVIRTMTSAGRTVIFSAVIVATSMVPLALFPMYFLRSFAYAGVGVVAFALCAALVITPAAITVLGARLDSWDIRRLIRRLMRRTPAAAEPAPRAVCGSKWYRWAKAVMRHWLVAGLAVTVVLLLLGAPFLGVRWGFPDERVLPRSASAHQVGHELRTNFATDSASDVTVVLPDAPGLTADELAGYAARLSEVTDVAWVSAPAGTFVRGRSVGPPSAPTGIADGSAFVTVGSVAPLFSDDSLEQLNDIRAVPAPGGTAVQLTGTAQINHDIVVAVTSRLTVVLTVIALTTLVWLFLLTGSIVLPIKALVLNALSLTAAFGALVWIFQDGHLGALGTTPSGTMAVTMPALLLCVAFGISMDYEVFLIARIREHWLASSRTAAANDEAVALGVARTARVITAAALIMSISFAALIGAQVSFMRMIGLGLMVAVLVDATLVRLILVPAFMHVMGRANWWAPAPLARWHDRFGIREAADAPDRPRSDPAPTPVAAVAAGAGAPAPG